MPVCRGLTRMAVCTAFISGSCECYRQGRRKLYSRDGKGLARNILKNNRLLAEITPIESGYLFGNLDVIIVTGQSRGEG